MKRGFGVIGLLLTLLAGCEEDEAAELRARAERIRAQAEASARAARSAARPAMNDAAAPVRAPGSEESAATDPAPATGDLAADMAHFTTIDDCVRERHLDDAVLGDAVLALGYDGFARDACRVLGAAKSGNASDCRAITVSSLARHCESLVAVTSKTPDACPRDPLGPGREPTCLALASRDRRLCAAVREDERARCEALLSGDEKRCAAAPRTRRPACERDVARLRGVLKDTVQGAAPFVTPSGSFKIDPKNDAGMRGLGEGSLAFVLREGLVVSAESGTPIVHFELGNLVGRAGEERAPLYASVDPGVFVTITATAPDKGATTTATVERFDLVVPGGGAYSAPPVASNLTATVKRLEPVRGGAIELTVEGTVGEGERIYGVRVEAKSFVRDVVTVAARARKPATPPVKPR